MDENKIIVKSFLLCLMNVFENCLFESGEPELLLSSAFTLTAVAFN